MCDNNPTYSATKDNASLRKLHDYVLFKIIGGGKKLHAIVLHTVQNISVRKITNNNEDIGQKKNKGY